MISTPSPFGQRGPSVPSAGRRKPLHKRVWVWLVGVLAGLIVIGAVFGEPQDEQTGRRGLAAAPTPTVATPSTSAAASERSSAAAASASAASASSASAASEAASASAAAEQQRLAAACVAWNADYLVDLGINPSATRAAQAAYEAAWAAKVPAGCAPTSEVTAALLAAQQTAAALEDAASAPKPSAVAPQPVAPAPAPVSAYYANCAAARAAGAAPLYRGDPGYRAALDRDNDGVACE